MGWSLTFVCVRLGMSWADFYLPEIYFQNVKDLNIGPQRVSSFPSYKVYS
jgi:hypothetical protein